MEDEEVKLQYLAKRLINIYNACKWSKTKLYLRKKKRPLKNNINLRSLQDDYSESADEKSNIELIQNEREHCIESESVKRDINKPSASHIREHNSPNTYHVQDDIHFCTCKPCYCGHCGNKTANYKVVNKTEKQNQEKPLIEKSRKVSKIIISISPNNDSKKDESNCKCCKESPKFLEAQSSLTLMKRAVLDRVNRNAYADTNDDELDQYNPNINSPCKCCPGFDSQERSEIPTKSTQCQCDNRHDVPYTFDQCDCGPTIEPRKTRLASSANQCDCCPNIDSRNSRLVPSPPNCLCRCPQPSFPSPMPHNQYYPPMPSFDGECSQELCCCDVGNDSANHAEKIIIPSCLNEDIKKIIATGNVRITMSEEVNTDMLDEPPINECTDGIIDSAQKDYCVVDRDSAKPTPTSELCLTAVDTVCHLAADMCRYAPSQQRNPQRSQRTPSPPDCGLIGCNTSQQRSPPTPQTASPGVCCCCNKPIRPSEKISNPVRQAAPEKTSPGFCCCDKPLRSPERQATVNQDPCCQVQKPIQQSQNKQRRRSSESCDLLPLGEGDTMRGVNEDTQEEIKNLLEKLDRTLIDEADTHCRNLRGILAQLGKQAAEIKEMKILVKGLMEIGKAPSTKEVQKRIDKMNKSKEKEMKRRRNRQDQIEDEEDEEEEEKYSYHSSQEVIVSPKGSDKCCECGKKKRKKRIGCCGQCCARRCWGCCGLCCNGCCVKCCNCMCSPCEKCCSCCCAWADCCEKCCFECVCCKRKKKKKKKKKKTKTCRCH